MFTKTKCLSFVILSHYVPFTIWDDVVNFVVWKSDTPLCMALHELFQVRAGIQTLSISVHNSCIWQVPVRQAKALQLSVKTLPVCHLTLSATLDSLTHRFLLVLSKFLSTNLDFWLRTSLMCDILCLTGAYWSSLGASFETHMLFCVFIVLTVLYFPRQWRLMSYFWKTYLYCWFVSMTDVSSYSWCTPYHIYVMYE